MEFTLNITSKRNTPIPSTITLPASKERMPLLLMAHGFCSNRDEDGAFSTLAKRIADIGIASIRIDFPGCNDSSEPYLYNTIENDVDDLRSAYEYMTSNYLVGDVYIIGYSMGGKVAVHYIDKYKDIKAALFYAPAITNGLDWHSSLELGQIGKMNNALKIAKEKGHYDYFNTFDETTIQLSKEFLEQCLTYRTYDIFNGFNIPCLMVYGDKDDIIPLDIYQDIIKNCQNMLFESHLIKEADHGFGMWNNRPDLFKQLGDVSFKFLQRIKNSG